MDNELEQFKLITAARDRVAKARKEAGVKGIARSSTSKKIVALSCGSKNGYCETFIKAAAMGAEEFGIETEIIRASELTVKPCKACEACVITFAQGKLARCPVKDDALWILEQCILDERALIVAAPVYHLTSNALLLALTQRMHPTMFNNLDKFFNDRKVAGIISNSAGIDGWSSFGLTVPHLWVEHFAKVVDQIDIQYRRQDVDWFERAKQLGRNVAKAMAMPIEQVTYAGEQSRFACPVCHCDVLRMPGEVPRSPYRGELRYKLSDVVCPICWVHGNLSRKDGALAVEWDEWDVLHPRFSEYGVFEHLNVIIENALPGSDLYLPDIANRTLPKKWASYGKYIKP